MKLIAIADAEPFRRWPRIEHPLARVGQEFESLRALFWGMVVGFAPIEESDVHGRWPGGEPFPFEPQIETCSSGK